MDHQQKIKNAERLIPQLAILILQYLIQQCQQKHLYQLKMHAFHSVLFYNRFQNNPRGEQTVESTHSLLLNKTGSLITEKFQVQEQSKSKRFGLQKYHRRKIWGLDQQKIKQNNDALILQDYKEQFSKKDKKKQGSPAQMLFQQEQEQQNHEYQAEKIVKHLQFQNNSDTEQINHTKYQSKQVQRGINSSQFNQQKTQMQFQKPDFVRQIVDGRQLNATNKYSLLPEIIIISFFKNIFKNIILKLISPAFSRIKIKALKIKNINEKSLKDFGRQLQEKDDYIFELQSDLTMKNQEIIHMKKAIKYYKKALNNKGKHQRTTSSYSQNSNVHENDTIQTSLNTHQSKREEKIYYGPNYGQLKQFKLIYRVDDDVDVNIGNSIKIHFSRDSRDSKRSFIHAENININEMRDNVKKEELFD